MASILQCFKKNEQDGDHPTLFQKNMNKMDTI